MFHCPWNPRSNAEGSNRAIDACRFFRTEPFSDKPCTMALRGRCVQPRNAVVTATISLPQLAT
jgi:hypothetical protein